MEQFNLEIATVGECEVLCEIQILDSGRSKEMFVTCYKLDATAFAILKRAYSLDSCNIKVKRKQELIAEFKGAVQNISMDTALICALSAPTFLAPTN